LSPRVVERMSPPFAFLLLPPFLVNCARVLFLGPFRIIHFSCRVLGKKIVPLSSHNFLIHRGKCALAGTLLYFQLLAARLSFLVTPPWACCPFRPWKRQIFPYLSLLLRKLSFGFGSLFLSHLSPARKSAHTVVACALLTFLPHGPT